MIQARRMDEFEDLKARNQLGRRKKQVQVLEDKRRVRRGVSYLALSLPYLIHLIFSQKRGVSYHILSPKCGGSRSLKTCNKVLKLPLQRWRLKPLVEAFSLSYKPAACMSF